jgi:small subunit ribosomal protein S16
MGSKKRPFYRIISTDSRNPRDGRFIETLGYYNPMTEPADVKIEEDLIFKWLERGAQPTESTEQILRRFGIMKKWSLLKQGVPRDELDAKYEALKSKETPPVSAEERRQKAEAEKAEAEKAEAEKAEAKKAEAEEKPEAGTPPAEAPAAGEDKADDAEAEKKE